MEQLAAWGKADALPVALCKHNIHICLKIKKQPNAQAKLRHVIVIDRHFREEENGAVAKTRVVCEKNDSPEGGLKT